MATYWYEGFSPQGWLRLPRTVEVEAIAHSLMANLYSSEGKMYGVLLVETATGDRQILKAFSGLLNGSGIAEGWVPPIPGREQVAFAEAQTLEVLADLKQKLIALQSIPERQQYESLSQDFAMRLQAMGDRHHQQKEQRSQVRATHPNPEILDEQSRQDGMERRNLKRERDHVLQPLKQMIEQADLQIVALKKQRKARSQLLQSQMHESYKLINFLGTSATLHQLMPQGMPTGTGDCCAPKLLHYAATHQLKPIALAEFWWGESTADKISGQFYGACAERCQPLMGFMLAGLPIELAILHEDEWLIAVDKPAGLLSVPGRYGDRQDSVLTRLQLQGKTVFPVHRLDQETSGILLFAKDQQIHRQLSQQFQQRQVHKIYEAVLGEPDPPPKSPNSGGLSDQSPPELGGWGASVRLSETAQIPSQGIIELPLWSDPQDRPRQKVDWQRGKPSITKYRVLDSAQKRIEFVPVTGRTHQIRVHAAAGLGVPILGDRLYGCHASTRLHLHAKELHFIHPQSQQKMHLIQDWTG
jgi:tRNA pseudouridine32 synthase / 23S rRNA pseudouridine746 synthase